LPHLFNAAKLGVLAGFVKYNIANKKGPPEGGPFYSMVAGTGFEPVTFRL
jgi:hypothetical protein